MSTVGFKKVDAKISTSNVTKSAVVQVGLDEKTAKNSRGLNVLLNKCLLSKKKETLLYIFLVNKRANELSHLKLLNSSAL